MGIKLFICNCVDWVIENPEKYFTFFAIFLVMNIIAGVKEWWDERRAENE